MSETPVLDDPNESGQDLAVLESGDTLGPACEKCGKPFASEQTTACPHCGWYKVLGTYVEIAPEWESAASQEPGEQPPQKSPFEVWAGLIPKWCWVAGACGLAAVVMSIVARLAIQDAALLTTWSVTQLFAGLGVAFACHVAVFVLMAMDDPDLGLSDMVVNPLRGWRKLFVQMPRNQWALCLFNFAMTSAVGAVLIIGGIPYERIWDWGISPPAKKNLLDAIANAAPAEGGSDMSMEEAMQSFAGDAALKGQGDKPKTSKSGPANLVRKKTDALILGYQLDGNGAISVFYIASEINGTLVYGGRVTPDLTPDESLELLERLRAAKTARPLVSAPDEGFWVQPRFTCRVTYDKRVESGRLQGLLWEEMLGEVKLPW